MFTSNSCRGGTFRNRRYSVKEGLRRSLCMLSYHQSCYKLQWLVELDSSFAKPTAGDRVRMMIFNSTWIQIIFIVTWDGEAYCVKRPTFVPWPHQVNLKLPPWPVRLAKKNSTTLPPYLLGVSFPAPRLNTSLTAVHRSWSYQNTGCNIPLTHRWNEKQIARWTGGTLAQQGGESQRWSAPPVRKSNPDVVFIYND